MSAPIALDIAAFALAALFIVLGLRVSRHALGTLDARAALLRARGTRLAVVFTESGRGVPLTAGYILAIAIFAVLRFPIWIPLTLASSQLITQMIANAFKLLYRRTRPDYWLVGQEAGHSYPSGHATTAMVSYCGWALAIGFGALPLVAKVLVCAALVLWALGVAWSRLALGAHYFTDIAGGTLLGCAWLCAVASLFLRSGLMHGYM